MTNPQPSPPATTQVRWLSELRSWLVLLLIVLGLHSVIARPFYIPSESMMPTLLVGDHLIVSKFRYGWSYASVSFYLMPPMGGRLWGRLPPRGDVIVFERENSEKKREDLTKRVIGLPGDTVQMIAGRLWLNGSAIATRDLGSRLVSIDGNFRCSANDPDPARRFPGFMNARVVSSSGTPSCRLNFLRETLTGGGPMTQSTPVILGLTIRPYIAYLPVMFSCWAITVTTARIVASLRTLGD